jgi:integrase
MAHMYSFGEIRILTPDEYNKLRAFIPQDRHKMLLDILLITGMRYVEACRLWNNPKWFNPRRNIIHLPPEAQRKHKRTQQERTIQPLPSMFGYILRDFWEARRPPSESSWNRDLRKWAEMAGIHPYGLSAKTTRKTIESWMIASGLNESRICLRSGHDNLTSMRHYQNLAFSDSELNDIKKQLTAWGMLT